MRRLLPLAAVMAALTMMPAKAEVWSVYGINGNDTGGIIPWSPALRAYGYRDGRAAALRRLSQGRAHHQRGRAATATMSASPANSRAATIR